MNRWEKELDKYAELAVKVGVNIQPGQTLFVNAPLEAAPLVRKIAKTAYETGAKHVYVEWNDEALTYIKFHHAPRKRFPNIRCGGRERWKNSPNKALPFYPSTPRTRTC
ncbi:Aminopeptidase 2 [Geobacillus sp. BCO2]|nr:Aminopeptidase 2 [Geobacillus sp. BCO2]